MAGPKRPQDRVLLKDAAASFAEQLPGLLAPTAKPLGTRTAAAWERKSVTDTAVAEKAPVHVTTTVKERFNVDPDRYLDHGSVVIAAITSCTNTSNPSVMVAAGILAKKAVEKGLTVPPWVKTSLAPGSRVVTDYYDKGGPAAVSRKAALQRGGLRLHDVHRQLRTAAGRCFEEHRRAWAGCGERAERQPQLRGARERGRAGQLSDEPAAGGGLRAGRADRAQLRDRSAGHDKAGKPVYLKDIWPTQKEVAEAIEKGVNSESFRQRVCDGEPGRRELAGAELPDRRGVPVGAGFDLYPAGAVLRRDDASTPAPVEDIVGARVLAVLGDSVTTDHISPAGSIKANGPAGKYLAEHGVKPADFNSYGSRRGNHEVMVRGTFANVRLRNRAGAGHRGRRDAAAARGRADVDLRRQREVCRARRAADRYWRARSMGPVRRATGRPKGPKLLGVRAVIAESYERIHRSNLVGMGILAAAVRRRARTRSRWG